MHHWVSSNAKIGSRAGFGLTERGRLSFGKSCGKGRVISLVTTVIEKGSKRLLNTPLSLTEIGGRAGFGVDRTRGGGGYSEDRAAKVL